MALGQSLPAVIRFLLPIEIQDISQSCLEDAMPSVWFPGTAPDTRGAGWVGGGGTQAGQPGLRGLAIWQPCLSTAGGQSRAWKPAQPRKEDGGEFPGRQCLDPGFFQEDHKAATEAKKG